MNAFDIVKNAVWALDHKKGENISVIKVEDLTSFAEYFVIASATSSPHVRALCDEVEEKLEENGLRVGHIEGRSTGWIVLDYGSVIVHVFSRHEREFYGLDKMWSDGKVIDISEIIDTEA